MILEISRNRANNFSKSAPTISGDLCAYLTFGERCSRNGSMSFFFKDYWDMPARTTAVCGCGAPAREHPRRPPQLAQGNYCHPVNFIVYI